MWSNWVETSTSTNFLEHFAMNIFSHFAVGVFLLFGNIPQRSIWRLYIDVLMNNNTHWPLALREMAGLALGKRSPHAIVYTDALYRMEDYAAQL